MQCVGIELFACHVPEDGGRQVHQTSGLVVGCVTPSVALLSLLGTVGVELCDDGEQDAEMLNAMNIPLTGLRPRFRLSPSTGPLL